MSNSFFYFSMAIGVALGSWGAYLAEKKNRSRQLGFLLGFFFGALPIVQNNFEIVIFGIIGLSLLPMVIEFIRAKMNRKNL